eukprot:1118616-Prymnesium_polylepis.1
MIFRSKLGRASGNSSCAWRVRVSRSTHQNGSAPQMRSGSSVGAAKDEGPGPRRRSCSHIFAKSIHSNLVVS